MRFKRLRTVVGLSVVLFIFVTGLIIITGMMKSSDQIAVVPKNINNEINLQQTVDNSTTVNATDTSNQQTTSNNNQQANTQPDQTAQQPIQQPVQQPPPVMNYPSYRTRAS